MNLLIFVFVSLIILYLGNNNSAIYLVTIISSFFPYYLGLAIFNIDLQHGGTFFIYVFFCCLLLIHLLMRMKNTLRINSIDRFYFLYWCIWIVFYLINFNIDLFSTNQFYKQAPFFLTFTLLIPVLLKPLYSPKILKITIDWLEIIGFGAALIVLLFLILGFPSKEIWWDTDNQKWELISRYTPIRGFFSIRQATLFAMAIIVFISKLCYDATKTKQLFYKLPLVLISFGGIIISGSRGIMIICSLMTLYLLLTKLQTRHKIIAVFVVAILIVSLDFFFHISQYQNLSTRVFNAEVYQSKVTGLSVRFSGYQLGLTHFLERPIMGNGMSRISPKYGYSHNIFISILEDTGFAGFLWLSCFIMFMTFRLRWKDREVSKYPEKMITRNLILFLFLASNLYGTIVSYTSLFLLLSIYYSNYQIIPTERV